MLTEHEINKVFLWLPYRETWTVDKTKRNYNDLIQDFTDNEHFETFYSQDGGMTNYLEFFCYPVLHNGGKMNAVIVCVSLYAPTACYGQTTIHYINSRSVEHEFLKIENVGIIVDKQLLSDVAENMENLNEGNKYLHGLFQWTD